MFRHVPVKHMPVRYVFGHALKYVSRQVLRHMLEHVPQNRQPNP